MGPFIAAVVFIFAVTIVGVFLRLRSHEATKQAIDQERMQAATERGRR